METVVLGGLENQSELTVLTRSTERRLGHTRNWTPSQLAKETATEQTTSRSGCKPAVAPHASMAHTTKCSQRPWGSRSLTSFKAHDRLRLASKLTWGSVKIPQSQTRVLDRRLTAQESGQGPLCADAQQPKGTEAQNKWRTTSLQVQKKAQCTPPGAHSWH